MSEHKFRGKRKDNGEWVYWNEFGECSEPYVCQFGIYSHISKEDIITETVGRYIGLKDKSGNEVYEGDIINAWSQGYCGIFQIKWREDGGGSPMFILYPAWQNREMWHISSSREKDGMCYDRGLEVISNTHDNPELLEAN